MTGPSVSGGAACPSGKTAGSARELGLDGRVFNTFFKIYFLTARQFLIISSRTTRLDSPFHLLSRESPALLITPHPMPDNRDAKRQTQQSGGYSNLLDSCSAIV